MQMSDNWCYPDWIPELVGIDVCGGNPAYYLDYLYALFQEDFVRNKTCFRGLPVVVRREPERNGKMGAFWHLISNEDSQNVPATLERHKRIRWPSAIIKHFNDPIVKVWESKNHKGGKHGKKIRTKLWFNEEYLVVLEASKGKYFLITGFCTDTNHYRRKLRSEFDAYKKAEAERDNSTPTSGSPSTPCR